MISESRWALAALAVILLLSAAVAGDASVQALPGDHSRLLVSPDGRWAATWAMESRWSRSARNGVAIWTADPPAIRAILPIPAGDAAWMRMPSGLRLVLIVAGADAGSGGAAGANACLVIDPATGGIEASHAVPVAGWLTAVLAAPEDGICLIATVQPAAVHRFDARSGRCAGAVIAAPTAAADPVIDLTAAAPRLLGSDGARRRTTIWRDGDRLMVADAGAGSSDASVRILNRDGSLVDAPAGTRWPPPGDGEDTGIVRLGSWPGAAGETLLRQDGTWRLRSAAGERILPIQTLSRAGGELPMTSAGDGALLAIAGDAGTDIVDVRQRRAIRRAPMAVVGASLQGLAFSPDRRWLGIASFSTSGKPPRLSGSCERIAVASGDRASIPMPRCDRMALTRRWLLVGAGREWRRWPWHAGGDTVELAPGTISADGLPVADATGDAVLWLQTGSVNAGTFDERRSDPYATEAAVLDEGRWIALAAPAGIAVHRGVATPAVATFPGRGPLAVLPSGRGVLHAPAEGGDGAWGLIEIGPDGPRSRPTGWRSPPWTSGREAIAAIDDRTIAWGRCDGAVAIVDLESGRIGQIWRFTDRGWWVCDGDGRIQAWGGDLVWHPAPPLPATP